jgi:hypothetical protein
MTSIAAVEELTYRQSRLCRLLGNPVAFAVVALLTSDKDLSTGEIARATGRSVPRTSNILGALRLAEVVRYETEGRYACYRLKHPREIRRILEALSGFVKTTSVGAPLIAPARAPGYLHVFAIAKTSGSLQFASTRKRRSDWPTVSFIAIQFNDALAVTILLLDLVERVIESKVVTASSRSMLKTLCCRGLCGLLPPIHLH